MGRKYEKYKITVQYLNGDTEDVNLMGIRCDSYTKMLEVYHRIKSTYTNKVKTIDFIGQCMDGSMKVMWTKEIKPQGQQELRQDINEIMANISREMQIIKDKNFYSFYMIDALTKKENILLHQIEDLHMLTFKNETEKDNEKLRLFNVLEETRIERRWHKDQFKTIAKLQESKIGDCQINFTHLSNVFKIKCDTHKIRPLNMKLAEELRLYKEEPIVNKEKQIAQNKKFYDRVIIDAVENKLICYNKAK